LDQQVPISHPVYYTSIIYFRKYCHSVITSLVWSTVLVREAFKSTGRGDDVRRATAQRVLRVCKRDFGVVRLLVQAIRIIFARSIAR